MFDYDFFRDRFQGRAVQLAGLHAADPLRQLRAVPAVAAEGVFPRGEGQDGGFDCGVVRFRLGQGLVDLVLEPYDRDVHPVIRAVRSRRCAGACHEPLLQGVDALEQGFIGERRPDIPGVRRAVPAFAAVRLEPPLDRLPADAAHQQWLEGLDGG